MGPNDPWQLLLILTPAQGNKDVKTWRSFVFFKKKYLISRWKDVYIQDVYIQGIQKQHFVLEKKTKQKNNQTNKK